jgi:uncharacterized membrane protein
MPWRRYVLYALGAPFAFVAFWGFLFIGPIGWGILLVVAIIDLLAIHEQAKDRRHREVIEAIERSGRFPS